MRRIHLANVLLICVLGTLLLWPNINKPVVHKSINTAYDSVCMIVTDSYTASGVLLESGYILTAAHAIDRNSNGKIEKNESIVMLQFSSANHFKVQATAIAIGSPKDGLDIAILIPDQEVPLPGVKLMATEEYWQLKIGEPIYIIGMQNGLYPASITDGRITSTKRGSHAHRSSATIYYGSSGGGIFTNDKLIGIVVAVGIGKQILPIPMYNQHGIQYGIVNVPYEIPLANSSSHTPAPSVIDFLIDKNLPDALWEHPPKCPYEAYFAVSGFNLALIFWLFIIFRLMSRKIK